MTNHGGSRQPHEIMYVPILGRISFSAYLRLIFAYALLFFEVLFRPFALILPIQRLADVITKLAPRLVVHETKKERDLMKMQSTEDFARYWYVISKYA